MNRHQSPIWAVLVPFVGLQLAGCSQYMDRKDTIAFSAGEAVQTNIITHVPDPWPVHARNKEIAFSGERIARAVRRYECGSNSSGSSSSRQNSTAGTSGASQNGSC